MTYIILPTCLSNVDWDFKGLVVVGGGLSGWSAVCSLSKIKFAVGFNLDLVSLDLQYFELFFTLQSTICYNNTIRSREGRRDDCLNYKMPWSMPTLTRQKGRMLLHRNPFDPFPHTTSPLAQCLKNQIPYQQVPQKQRPNPSLLCVVSSNSNS